MFYILNEIIVVNIIKVKKTVKMSWIKTIASYPSLTLIDFHNYCKEGLLTPKNIIICKM